MKLQVGDKTLTIRKWKGKDKKNFIKALNKKPVDEAEVMNAIGYSCIEEDEILSIDEFRYVLSRIRALSLGEEYDVDFYCKECGEVYNKKFKLDETFKFSYKPLNEINVDDVHIKLGTIKNKDAYLKRINEDKIFDLLLRIESFNCDDTFTLDSLIDMFDDLDIDVLTKIFEIYNDAKFTVQDVNDVQCPCCKNVQSYKFDEIPGFFPKSWFE